MAKHFLSDDAALNLLKLGKAKTTPQLRIRKLREEIQRKINTAELRGSVTSEIDPKETAEIVAMKLELDCLYALWAEGKL